MSYETTFRMSRIESSEETYVIFDKCHISKSLLFASLVQEVGVVRAI
jgi:hypothetical protein